MRDGVSLRSLWSFGPDKLTSLFGWTLDQCEERLTGQLCELLLGPRRRRRSPSDGAERVPARRLSAQHQLLALRGQVRPLGRLEHRRVVRQQRWLRHSVGHGFPRAYPSLVDRLLSRNVVGRLPSS
jgi:hypothetical protein